MTIQIRDLIASLPLSADQAATITIALADLAAMPAPSPTIVADLVDEERALRVAFLEKTLTKRVTDRDAAKAIAKIETATLAAAASEIRRSQKARKLAIAQAYAEHKAAQAAAIEGRTHDAAVHSAPPV